MPLDPQAQAIRDRRAADRVAALYEMSLDQAREADLADIRAGGGDPEPVAAVEEHVFAGPGGPLTVRLYRPSLTPGLPVLVYLFGGGWTLGSIDTADGIARSLANAAGCVVATPGYRLAPEAKFPAAVNDCVATLRWVAEHATELDVDGVRIAVGGDSAGGNLAAACTLALRDDGGPKLVGQLLIYPNTDYLADTASMREKADPWLFNRTSVAWYWGHYLTNPSDGANPLASPLRAPDVSGLPPAFVLTAEFDPLRDEGEDYAARLSDAGVPVTARRYHGVMHGFFAMAGTLDAGAAAVAEAAGELRRWFGGDKRGDKH
jgi:acetyl esterase